MINYFYTVSLSSNSLINEDIEGVWYVAKTTKYKFLFITYTKTRVYKDGFMWKSDAKDYIKDTLDKIR